MIVTSSMSGYCVGDVLTFTTHAPRWLKLIVQIIVWFGHDLPAPTVYVVTGVLNGNSFEVSE